jgi:hypothetical protein
MTYTYTYTYDRTLLLITKIDELTGEEHDIAFLEGDDAHELAAELSVLTPDEVTELLSMYDD